MPKKRKLVSLCDVGTILAEDVVTYQGIILVAKDSVMNQYILGRLLDMGILYIWTYSSQLLETY
ncbi:MAG TPA: hypothetical protein VFC58_14355 [Desulfosporosinus sp.]|nr:hypothetical protein [Desulfosporosinus sp.]